MSTEEMIGAAPEGVEVLRFRLPSAPADLSEFDRVVVGATEHLSRSLAERLMPVGPVYWVRSAQPQWLDPFFRASRLLVWPSHECARWHRWSQDNYQVCPAPMDTTLIPRGVPKENFALWAGRSVGHKGRVQAEAWAAREGVRLVGLTNVPRATVLEAMGRARWFVHLPVGTIDACPRTVIEAEIAGCEIVVNDLVGRVPVRGADEVAKFVDGVAGRFWAWTLDGRLSAPGGN
jgi:hypothetical protein